MNRHIEHGARWFSAPTDPVTLFRNIFYYFIPLDKLITFFFTENMHNYQIETEWVNTPKNIIRNYVEIVLINGRSAKANY